MTLNVMIDLETLGVNPGCAIMSIGAVAFDEADVFTETFNRMISFQSCRAVGLIVERGTRNWWRSQPDRTLYDQVVADGGGVDLPDVLTRFNSWFTAVAPVEQVLIWSNGAAFDLPILNVAYRACGFRSPPWEPFSDRCYRTLKNLRPEIRMERTGEHHNALDDAKSQALHAIRLLRALREPTSAIVPVDPPV